MREEELGLINAVSPVCVRSSEWISIHSHLCSHNVWCVPNLEEVNIRTQEDSRREGGETQKFFHFGKLWLISWVGVLVIRDKSNIIALRLLHGTHLLSKIQWTCMQSASCPFLVGSACCRANSFRSRVAKEKQRKNRETFIPFETTSRIKQLKNSFMRAPSIKKGFERIQKGGCVF